MPDPSARDIPDHPKEEPGSNAQQGVDPRFPDLPSGLMPSRAGHSRLTEQETRNAAQAIAQLEDKMIAVSVELAQGRINQSQFQAIYTRHCEQKMVIEHLLADDPKTDAWKHVAAEGYSGSLRRQYAAHVTGMLIVEIQSAQLLKKLGNFDLARELLVPILESLVGGNTPTFDAGARSTQIEGGRWLSFVPGEFCVAIAVFSLEPSPAQLKTIADLHRDFERINQQRLMAGEADPNVLIFPQRVLFDAV